MTETSAVDIELRRAHEAGTVGEPYPGTEVRLDPRLARSDQARRVFKGYWNKPDKTSRR